jgi:ABC-type branched-subunit amino acid transport system substrate-binding protein
MIRSAIAAGVAVSLAGPVAAQVQGVTDTEILIGTHLDLSGPVAPAMPTLRNGTQMRFDEANEKGGIHGRKLRLIVEDNAYQPAQAVRAMQKLARSDSVFAVINAFGTGTNLAAVKTAADAKVVYFAPWGASAVIHGVAKSPLVFTTVPNYDAATAIALSWAIKNLGAKKVAAIYQGDAFGELLLKGYKQALQVHGLASVAEASYKPGDVDFSSQVARVRNAGADLVVLATVTRETVGVMNEIRKVGWKDVKVLASVPGTTKIVVQLGKDATEGLYGTANWRFHYPDSAPAAVKAWMESYRKRFNVEPDENSIMAYSYADWFVKALEAAGRDFTVEAFLAALQRTTHEDIFGNPKAWFKNNHIDPETVQIMQVKGGRWTPVSADLTDLTR